MRWDTLHLRRLLTIAGILLVIGAIGTLTTFGLSVKDTEIDKPWVFLDAQRHPLIDSASGRVYIYVEGGATTGTGIELVFDSSDSSWVFDSVAVEGVYKAWHYDDYGATQVLANRWIKGSDSGDTTITRWQAFADSVIPQHALQESIICPRHMVNDSTYHINIGADGSVNVNALPATDLLESEWGTWFQPSFDDSLMLGTYDAYFDTLRADTLYALEIEVDSIFCAESTEVWIEDIETDSLYVHALFLGGATTRWDDGSEKIDGNVIADDTIDDDALDFGGGADQIDLDDVPNGASYDRAPACGGVAHIIVGSGAGEWASVNPGSDVEVASDGTMTIQDNSIDAEDVASSDDPAAGDLAGAGAADAWTWQTAAERNIWTGAAPIEPDSAYYGTTTFTTDSWTEWKSGAAVGDIVLVLWTGEPAYYSQVGEYSAYSIGAFVTQAGRVDFEASPDVAKTHGGTSLAYWIIGRP